MTNAFLSCLSCDLIETSRNHWLWISTAFFSLVAASLALTTRFGFGMELPMLAESGQATALAASAFVAAFAAESALAKSGLSCKSLFASRPMGMWAKTFSSSTCAAACGFLAFSLVHHSVACAGLAHAGHSAAPLACTACVVASLALLLACAKKRLGIPAVSAAFLLAIAPAALLPAMGPPSGKLLPGLESCLIYGAAQSILLAGVAVLAQAAAPGPGGIALSLLAFLAGSMKAIFRFEDCPPAAGRLLEAAFGWLPDFHSAGSPALAGGTGAPHTFDAFAYAAVYFLGASAIARLLSEHMTNHRTDR